MRNLERHLRHNAILVFSLLLSIHGHAASPFEMKTLIRDGVPCTMCASCDNPCQPPPSPPPPAITGQCPPPPAPTNSVPYWSPPPPPAQSYSYSSPPPPTGNSYNTYGTPPPPNPFLPYFPFYYYSPPPPHFSAASAPALLSPHPLLSLAGLALLLLM